MNPFAVYSSVALVSLLIGAAIGYCLANFRLAKRSSPLQVRASKYTCSTNDVEVTIPSGFLGWIIVEAFDATNPITLPPKPTTNAKKIEVEGPAVIPVEVTVNQDVKTRIRVWGAEALVHHVADCDCPNEEGGICEFVTAEARNCK